jgi:hypothetical protein
LSVVGNQYDLVVGGAFHHSQNTVEDAEFAGQFGLQFSIDKISSEVIDFSTAANKWCGTYRGSKVAGNNGRVPSNPSTPDWHFS